jgi:hypothetical protein
VSPGAVFAPSSDETVGPSDTPREFEVRAAEGADDLVVRFVRVVRLEPPT